MIAVRLEMALFICALCAVYFAIGALYAKNVDWPPPEWFWVVFAIGVAGTGMLAALLLTR